MKNAGWLCILFITGGFLSCTHPSEKYSVAIRDFTLNLQPYLTRVVATGTVGYDSDTKYVRAHMSDKEIKLLSVSENPLLRAVALRELLTRPSFDHFNIIMTHLDDTAVITTDNGEWGNLPGFVSDDVISNGRWKTEAAKTATVEEVIMHHNYLRSAFWALRSLERKPKYYPYINEMAGRDMPFEDTETALYALATYRKKEDISFIAQVLRNHHALMKDESFQIMGNFPNSTFWEILHDYYPRQFYRSICRKDRFSGAPEAYIHAVGAYKTDSSAKILQSILSRKPFMHCSADTSSLRRTVAYAIWNNPCLAYGKLRQQIKKEVEKEKTQQLEGMQLDTTGMASIRLGETTNPEQIRW